MCTSTARCVHLVALHTRPHPPPPPSDTLQSYIEKGQGVSDALAELGIAFALLGQVFPSFLPLFPSLPPSTTPFSRLQLRRWLGGGVGFNSAEAVSKIATRSQIPVFLLM